MIGRSALSNPKLPHQIAQELGLPHRDDALIDWIPVLQEFISYLEPHDPKMPHRRLMRLKQWMKIANNFGDFSHFDAVKHATTVEEFFDLLRAALDYQGSKQS